MKKIAWFLLLLIISILFSGCPGVGPDGDSSETETYTVTYDSNYSSSGSVPADTTNYQEGQTVTVLGNTGNLMKINVSDTPYRFDGWNTQEDGNGINYTDGIGTFTMGVSNITLYAKWIAYTLRDTGPAGGWIFYDKGSYSNGWRYLESAPEDQTSRAWGTYDYTFPGADGGGKQNTLDIIVGDPLENKAADECTNYSVEVGNITYNDWFLPSIEEMGYMMLNLHDQAVGGLGDDIYWTSTKWMDEELEASHASGEPLYPYSPGIFFPEEYLKLQLNCVRAARSF